MGCQCGHRFRTVYLVHPPAGPVERFERAGAARNRAIELAGTVTVARELLNG
ncbi:MAG: hypothetical protein AAFZ07_19510 [Actinomycetota bacterium]